jgi:hypothetical protein
LKVTILTCIHDKPLEVWNGTLAGLVAQNADQLVIVHDRSPAAIQRATEATSAQVTMVLLEGRPGWRSPCIAGNSGLAEATGDIVIYSPSDVVQSAGNMEVVRSHFAEHPKSVLFGRVTESDPERCKGTGHAGPVLQGSDCARPMTFLTAYPTQALRAIGGWDEAFQEGVCYEDDDLAARLWKHGLDFVFDDRLSGIHQSHARAFDGNNATQGYWTEYRVGLNRTIMVNKHGRDSALNVVMQDRPLVITEDGKVTWKHA